MGKSIQRFDYRRLGESLIERGLIDLETAEHVLNQCLQTGLLFPEILVQEDLVSDWEVARVACELYQLPFLTLEVYPPAKAASQGLDPEYLHRYALVPADRHGKVITVIMPGLVPSEALDHLQMLASAQVLPVVGSVVENRQWLNENLPGGQPATPMDAMRAPLPDGDEWASIFDAGEEAVQLELRGSDFPDGGDDGSGPGRPSISLD